MKIIVYVWIGLCLLSFNACTSAKKLVIQSPTRQFTQVDSLLDFLQSYRKFNYISAKGNADTHFYTFKEKMDVQLACRSDSAMTLSFRQFGFEGIKILIRPDSIFLINRLDKTFSSESFSGFMQQLDFEIDYFLLQDFLLFGQMVFDNIFYSLSQNSHQYMIIGQSEQIQSKCYLNKPALDTLRFQLQNRQTIIQSMVIQHFQKGQIAFPMKYNISIHQGTQVILKTHLVWDEWLTDQYKPLIFNIPNHYTKVIFSFNEE